MARKARNSSIELLRVIAMLMIVFHHFIVHGVLSNAQTWTGNNKFSIPISLYKNNMTAQIIAGGGKIGVDLFILIASYFLINSNINLKMQKNKLKKIIYPVWFYSILILLIAIFLHEHIGIKLLIRSVFPVLFVNYWFITDYIILFILAPFLNKMINNITKKQHLYLVILLIFFTSFCPTFLPSSLGVATNNLLLFFSIYATGAYIKKYPLKNEKQVGIILTSMSILILITSFIGLNLLAYYFNSESIYAHSAYLAHDYSFIVYLCAIGLFLWGKNWNLKPNKFVNGIAATTLGIYLIHDNPFMRNIIWINLLHLPKLMDGLWINIVVQAIVICPCYFLICSGIEFIRQKIFMILKSKKF